MALRCTRSYCYGKLLGVFPHGERFCGTLWLVFERYNG